MTLNELLLQLEGVRQNGSGYMACCPAHNDRNPSLSIAEGADGKILLHCHAGCSYENILTALGLSKSDLFPEDKTVIKQPKKIANTYDYRDEAGNLIVQKVRYDPKGFIWRRPNGNGGWLYGRGDAPHQLYAPRGLEEAVFLAEGEKDVDNLCTLGYCAASGENGAGPGKWLKEYTKQLKGRAIGIFQDNDQMGKAYAQEIAAALYKTAKSVRVLDLSKIWPEIPEKGDVSNLIERFGAEETTYKITELIAQTGEWMPGLELQGIDTIPRFFDGKRFLHNVMGDYLVKALGCCKINGAVHIYDDGLYKPGESVLHGHIIRLVPSLPDAKRREVYKYVKDSLGTPLRQVSPPNLIPFKSKVYDLLEDKFIDYSRDMVFLNRFPYDYKPDAPESKLVQDTLKEIACDDNEVIRLILESFGNCFYLLNAFRGSVMLYGQSGSNGKSTLLNMLTQMIGRENASFLSLQDTAERFRLVEVYGKAINVGDDIPSTYLPDSSRFKKLVTGETVIGERKGQDPIPFKPYAKMFFAMNSLPPVSDKSRAFFSRLLLIPLNNDFSQLGRKNVALKDRIWTVDEMEHLTRLSMEGLKRLMRQGDFTRPNCVEEELTRYETENNPVIGFLEDYNGEIIGSPTSLIYQIFRNWCDANGHKNVITANKFSREVCSRLNIKTKNQRHSYFHGEPGKCFTTIV